MRTIARTIRTTAAVTVERARALSRPRITAARPIIAARASRAPPLVCSFADFFHQEQTE